MTLRKFDFYHPCSLEELYELLERYGNRAKLIAGGTDLVVQMKEKKIAPDAVIDLLGLTELQGMDRREEGLRIGATVKLSTLENAYILIEQWGLLASAAHRVGSLQVRNRATIGGNLCNASPAADMAPPLLVMEAMVTLSSRKDDRRIPIESFFIGPGLTVLRPEELLKEIIIPPQPPHSFGVYLKLGRRKSMDLAIVSVAALLTLSPDKKNCKRARIAMGSVAPTPVRAIETERLLEGNTLNEDLINEASRRAEEECRPISDLRSTEAYRKEMVGVLVRRALRQALMAKV